MYKFDNKEDLNLFLIDLKKHWENQWGRNITKTITKPVHTTDGYFVNINIYTKPVGDVKGLIDVDLTGDLIENNVLEIDL